MNINLFDYYREELLPLTFTRPVGDLRCGIFTFAERWEKIIKNSTVGFQTTPYLKKKYTSIEADDLYFINASIFPNKTFIDALYSLDFNQSLYLDKILLAYRIANMKEYSVDFKSKIIPFKKKVEIIKSPWNLFSYNSTALEFDFNLLTGGRVSQAISSTNGVIGDIKKIFIEEGAKLEYTTLNSTNGSIYIGKNSEIMEGVNIRGSFSLGEHSIIHMGSKIYGSTTIGPYCKIGGEVNNVVFWGYSNKSHEGFLGNSVIGQWCNFGAGTNCSNLKNNYANIKSWSYKEKRFISTNKQFFGTIFGDYSRTAINTRLNTGTIVGVFSNIIYYDFPPNYIESFSWKENKNLERFKLSKVFEIAERIMNRRNVKLNEVEKQILEELYNSKY